MTPVTDIAAGGQTRSRAGIAPAYVMRKEEMSKKKTAVAAPDPRGKKLGVIASLLKGLREKKRPFRDYNSDRGK